MEPRKQQERRLRQLHDVSGQRPEDGQVLLWDAGTGKWVPGDVSSDIDPDDFAPALHASQHFTGEDDEITPADIGASPDDHNHDGVYSPIDHDHDGTYRQLSVPIDTADLEDESVTEDKLSDDVQDKLNAGGGAEVAAQELVTGSAALAQSVGNLYSASELPAGVYQVNWGIRFTRAGGTGEMNAVAHLANNTTQVGPELVVFSESAFSHPSVVSGSWCVTSGSAWTPRIRGRAFGANFSYSNAWVSILKIG